LENSIVATFACDTAILAVGSSNVESTGKLQTTINEIQKWTKKWHIQLNKSKSVHINFSNRCFEHIPVTINNQKVPYANTAKYLGMNLDSKRRWKDYAKKETKGTGSKIQKKNVLADRKELLTVPS
jgi:hypothetical protein